MVRHGQADGLIRADLPAINLAEMFMFMLFHAQMAWVADGQSDSAVKRVQQWVNVLLHGMCPAVSPESEKSKKKPTK